MARRQKHAPLNNSLSFSVLIDNESDSALEGALPAGDYSNPEALYILKENLNYLEDGNVFSDFELKVWAEYLKGRTYGEIALTTSKTQKSIDNALQRVKRKIVESLGVGK